MQYEYNTKGTCSQRILFEIEDGKVRNVQFLGGCNGNLQGISKLVEGMDVDEVIARIEGIHCGMKPTSCPDQLAKALEQHLIALGYEAVAPMCSDQFSWGDSEKFVKMSNWSERHTAHISGLGTFGLCDGLISKRGKAGRYGSVIVNHKFTPTPRDYTEYNEYCQAKNG